MSAGKLQALHKKWLKSNAVEDKEADSEEEDEETDEQDASVEEEDEDQDEDGDVQVVPSRSSSEAAAAIAVKDELDFELLPAAIAPVKASPQSVKAAGGPKPLGKKSNSKGLAQGEAEAPGKKEERVQQASADEDQREARGKSSKKKKRSKASPLREVDSGPQHAEEQPPRKKVKLKLATRG